MHKDFFSWNMALLYHIHISETAWGDTGRQPFFTDEQLKNMNRENLARVITLMQEPQTKLEAKQKILEEKAHELKFLGDSYQGYLTCDGYQAYHNLPEGITVTGCFAHARRRFDKCLTIMKKDFTKEQLTVLPG